MRVADLVGSALVSVTASWTVAAGERAPLPAHVWLELVPAGIVQVLATVQDTVELAREEPYAPYPLGGGDEIVVEVDRRTVPVENFVGETVRSVGTLGVAGSGDEVGWLLDFETGAAGFASVGHELVVGVWPDDRWHRLGIDRSD